MPPAAGGGGRRKRDMDRKVRDPEREIIPVWEGFRSCVCMWRVWRGGVYPCA